MSEKKFDFPTETVELPSKGLLYSEDSPLSSGEIEMKYMTAKEEDILTNKNYIEKGIVIDKLLESLIVSKIDFQDLLVGDKNALMVASRILGYGKDYKFEYKGEEIVIDLSLLENKELQEGTYTKGLNEFTYTTNAAGNVLTFRILTHKDLRNIEKEIQSLKKIHKNHSAELTTRLKYMITSVDGDSDKSTVNQFINNRFLARDARDFREYVKEIQPDVPLKFYHDEDGEVSIPININFFWPDV